MGTYKKTFPVLNKMILDGFVHLHEKTKLFDIDNIAAYLAATGDPTKPLEERTGPIRLPYQSIWVEFMTRHTKKPYPVGAMLSELAPGDEKRSGYLKRLGVEDLHPDAYLITAHLFDRDLLFSGNPYFEWRSKEGIKIDSLLQLHHGNGIGAMYPDTADQKIGAILAPITMAIGLMNVRNIDTEDRATETETKMQGKKVRIIRGKEYKVIKLPGAPSNRVDGEVKNEGATRYHTVRGHFKTYTAEKPLYGKLTGTWWWAPSVRGNRKNGEIISTYEQHPA